jgi:hypothetical protein
MTSSNTKNGWATSLFLGLIAVGVTATLCVVVTSQRRMETSIAAARERPAVEEPTERGTMAVAAFNAAGFKREIADMLDQKLRAAKSEPAPKPETAPAPEMTPERQARIDEARAVVDQAVAIHRWSEADRDRMAELVPSLGQEHFAAFMNDIVRALNEGKLVKDFRGPPI